MKDLKCSENWKSVIVVCDGQLDPGDEYGLKFILANRKYVHLKTDTGVQLEHRHKKNSCANNSYLIAT